MPKRDSLQHALNETRIELARADRLLTARWETLELLADPLIANDWDGSTRGALSDPTPHAAHTLARWHQLQTQTADTLEQLAGYSRLLTQLLQRIPSDIDTARLAELQRCTGGRPSTDTWTRPDCRRLAVTNDGLCDACRQRRDYHRIAV